MSLEELKEKALGLPMEPGVYIMKDSSGTIIYVGKAKMLKNRVSSYFRGAHNEKTTRMISCISTFDVIVANSEFEALVLENQLIKHYRPKYNILLKDDKGYPYIRLDLRKTYPTFSMVNTSTDDGAEYFGPFGGRHATREAIDAVCKALKLPTCGRRFPGDIGKERPCLNYHMGTCLAYCLRDTDSKLYGESISQAVMLLKGKGEELIAQLNHDMEAAAEELRFEYAAELRDRIKAIALLSQKQRVVSAAMADTDVIGFYRNPAKSCFVVLHFVSGQLLAKDFELMDSPLEDDSEAVASLVRQYYEQRKIAPKVIYLPWNVADMDSLSKFLSSVTEKSVAIQVPKRGEKLRLVETAIKNAREETDRYTSREEKTLKTLEWLKRALDLPEIPDRIESFR